MTKIKAKSIEKKLSKLIISIDNQWSPNDFIVVFKSIEFLYDYYRFFVDINYMLYQENNLKVIHTNQLPSRRYAEIMVLSSLNNIDFDPLDPLYSKREKPFIAQSGGLNPSIKIKKIQYASPGSIDFIGIGEVFKTIKELIMHYLPNTTQKLQNRKLQLEITKNEIEVLKQLGYDDLEIKAIVLKKEVATNRLVKLKENKKITEINIKTEK